MGRVDYPPGPGFFWPQVVFAMKCIKPSILLLFAIPTVNKVVCTVFYSKIQTLPLRDSPLPYLNPSSHSTLCSFRPTLTLCVMADVGQCWRERSLGLYTASVYGLRVITGGRRYCIRTRVVHVVVVRPAGRKTYEPVARFYCHAGSLSAKRSAERSRCSRRRCRSFASHTIRRQSQLHPYTAEQRKLIY